MENKIIKKAIEGKIVWDAYDEGMPIGNGRLGAMVPGGVNLDNLVLNQDSLWSTPLLKRSNPDAKRNLNKIRELLRNGNVEEADKLCFLAMTSTPKYFGSYEPMCNAWIVYNHSDRVDNYKRELDLEHGMAYTEYDVDGMRVHRESFASYEYQTIVYRVAADKPNLNLNVNLMRRPYETQSTDFVNASSLHISGRAGEKGVKFNCVLSAETDGEMETIGDYLYFKNASQVTLYISANTDFYEKKPLKKCLKQLSEVMSVGYNRVREGHIEDFSELYNRTVIDFGTQSDCPAISRVEKIRSGEKDTGMIELLFNYAKYLTISASRPGSQAMNLQGIWNDKFAPPWDCNYTININTEMNYWIAETAQLSECHEPLFDLLERMVPNGERVAKEVYGCNGFVAHHATNLWGDASINGNSFPSSVWPVGGAWLIKHMWEHYLFTGDKEFLEKRAFPIMKKSARFFMEYMTEAEDGCVETGPSLSPENLYITEEGTRGKHCMAPEMDNQLVRSLFRSLIKTCEILGCRDEDYEKYKSFAAKIRPTRINDNGGIMEWNKDYTENDPGHRHISPLFALCPDYEITPEKTPELAKACEETINRRLRGSDIEFIPGFSGWNGAWLSNCYTRLKKGNKALDALYTIIRTPNALSAGLLSRAPVFQIECNFGIASAVTEMLVYSDEEAVQLLPALPTDIKNGSFKGIATRGAFVIDAEWKDGRITKAGVLSKAGNICRIKASGLNGVNTEYSTDGDYIVFDTERNKVYELSFEG